jgi:hypothetical protein
MFMSPKARYNFLIDEAQRDALRAIKERDGIPESEQIRRAIDEWLERRGEKATASARQRVSGPKPKRR